MTDREQILQTTIDDMVDRYSNYNDQAARLLISDESIAGREERLLRALVMMVDLLLDSRDGQVDTLAESTGELAVSTLAAFGLMEFVYPPRFARWTQAGQEFLAETQQRWPAIKIQAALRRQRRQAAWVKKAFVAVFIAMATSFIVWLYSGTF